MARELGAIVELCYSPNEPKRCVNTAPALTKPSIVETSMADAIPSIIDIESEIWGDVPGFEGFYQASDQGRIRSLDRPYPNGTATRKGRILSPTPDSWAYPQVPMGTGNGRPQTRKVHRIVALTFLSKPDGDVQVNHKNGIKHDNRLVNLEWVTRAENLRHSREVLGNYHGSKKCAVVGVSDKGRVSFESTRAATAAGFHGSHISACCKGKLKTHRGYTWSYANG